MIKLSEFTSAARFRAARSASHQACPMFTACLPTVTASFYTRLTASLSDVYREFADGDCVVCTGLTASLSDVHREFAEGDPDVCTSLTASLSDEHREFADGDCVVCTGLTVSLSDVHREFADCHRVVCTGLTASLSDVHNRESTLYALESRALGLAALTDGSILHIFVVRCTESLCYVHGTVDFAIVPVRFPIAKYFHATNRFCVR